jgi:hypothetical protein
MQEEEYNMLMIMIKNYIFDDNHNNNIDDYDDTDIMNAYILMFL